MMAAYAQKSRLCIDLNLIARLADRLAGELRVDAEPSLQRRVSRLKFAAIFRPAANSKNLSSFRA